MDSSSSSSFNPLCSTSVSDGQQSTKDTFSFMDNWSPYDLFDWTVDESLSSPLDLPDDIVNGSLEYKSLRPPLPDFGQSVFATPEGVFPPGPVAGPSSQCDGSPLDTLNLGNICPPFSVVDAPLHSMSAFVQSQKASPSAPRRPRTSPRAREDRYMPYSSPSQSAFLSSSSPCFSPTSSALSTFCSLPPSSTSSSAFSSHSAASSLLPQDLGVATSLILPDIPLSHLSFSPRAQALVTPPSSSYSRSLTFLNAPSSSTQDHAIVTSPVIPVLSFSPLPFGEADEFVSFTPRTMRVSGPVTPPSPGSCECHICGLRLKHSGDLSRHLTAHKEADSKPLCGGLPLAEALAAGVDIASAKSHVFDGVVYYGGCHRIFSRRDALLRHSRFVREAVEQRKNATEGVDQRQKVTRMQKKRKRKQNRSKRGVEEDVKLCVTSIDAPYNVARLGRR